MHISHMVSEDKGCFQVAVACSARLSYAGIILTWPKTSSTTRSECVGRSLHLSHHKVSVFIWITFLSAWTSPFLPKKHTYLVQLCQGHCIESHQAIYAESWVSTHARTEPRGHWASTKLLPTEGTTSHLDLQATEETGLLFSLLKRDNPPFITLCLQP